MKNAIIFWISIAALLASGCSTPPAPQNNSLARASANATTQPSVRGTAVLKVPDSIQAEHRELHEMLEKVIGLGGKTGAAAKTVEQRLSEHFEKEEEYALPQLGLLRELAAGAGAADTQKAIELSDKLKSDLPKMLDEHKAVVEALDILKREAESEKKDAGVEFAAKLRMHAQNEEEVMYPAAILAGEFLKLQKNP